MQPPDQEKPSFDQPENNGQPGAFDQEPATSTVSQSVEPTPVDEPSSTFEPTPTVEPTSPTPSTEPESPAHDTPVAPAPVPQPLSSISPNPSPTPIPPKKSKKPLIIVIIVLLLALIGGGIAAGLSWYQNPDKVVMDSIINTASAEQGILTGDFTASNKDVKLNVTLDYKGKEGEGSIAAVLKVTMNTGELANKEFSINTDAVITKNEDVYFKVSNLQETVDAVIESVIDNQVQMYKSMGLTMSQADIIQVRTEEKQQFAGIVTKIDNQWIKVSADELKDNNDDSSTCFTDAFEKITTDKAAGRELAEVYQDNRFIIVKENLGSKDGSFGYVLGLDDKASSEFAKKVKNTTFGKELTKCDSDFFDETSSSTNDDIKDARFELWVDQWSHKITSIVFKGKVDDGGNNVDINSDFKFDYDTKVESPKVPSDAKSIKELQSDIEEIISPAATTSTTIVSPSV